MNFRNFLTKKVGMDKAIAYSTGARVVQAFTGPITILFISTFLSGVEQGFYYTFGSILAIQTFFELGLAGIITQFVAHEASHLKKNENGEYEGENKYKSRLSSLLHFSVKWYSIISLLFFIAIVFVGFVYFRTYGTEHSDVEWRWPWILISLSTAIKLFQSPLSAFLQGLNMVKEMNKISFIQQCILPLASWISLVCGFKLYVIGISSLLAVIFWNVYVHLTGIWSVLIKIWRIEIEERIAYMSEIFPMQWRIALSWVSGYFIFNFFNPVLFATDGPVVAGQMGMTLQVLNAIQSVGLAWITTKIPMLSGMIAQKKYVELDTMFFKVTKQMVLVLILMCIVLIVGLYILDISQFQIKGNVVRERFLPYLPVLLLIMAMIINDYIYAIATYLRCHKKEPFLWNSIAGGILCGSSTLIFGNMFGLYGVTTGYFLITLVLSFWGQCIFITCKKKWHNE